jgi:hypothetical protein
VADRALSLGGPVQDEHSATKVGCRSIGKHLVVKLRFKPDAVLVKENVGNLVCEDCGDAISVKPVLLMEVDEEVTGTR